MMFVHVCLCCNRRECELGTPLTGAVVTTAAVLSVVDSAES